LKKKFFVWLIGMIAIISSIAIVKMVTTEYLVQGVMEVNSERWKQIIATEINDTGVNLVVDGINYSSEENNLYVNNQLELMLPIDLVTKAFNCAQNFYNERRLVIEKGLNRIDLYNDGTSCQYNGEKQVLPLAFEEKNGEHYVSAGIFKKYFGYSYEWDNYNYVATMVNTDTEAITIPFYYNYVAENKEPKIRAQGGFGTCWAFASLTALESSLRPEDKLVFSIDHMVLKNSFSGGMYDGGDYTMSMAYLLGWQGPVLEKNDPYDGETKDNLIVEKHVQEIQIIEAKNFQEIKEMVYKYGGVQSSLYTSLVNSLSTSTYYNKENAAYCYIGDNKPNHDVVIIGWDDKYSKDNFNADVEGDGAFICRNSWGSSFGEEGNFYVSYYDSNIGVHNIVYTGVEDVDNYDNIYQTDLCGWVGNMGYKDMNSAYFANVYKAKNNESLEAVGFYATDEHTEYDVYVIDNYYGESSLNNPGEKVAEGKFSNQGYYTVELDNPIELKRGQEYAVMVYVTTPNSTKPIAVEFVNDERTSTVTLEDGTGFISLKGNSWESVEETKECNVCLKAYTSNR